MASVRHPGVVAIHDFHGDADGAAYLVMEYVEGESLSQLLARRDGSTRRPPWSWSRQVAAGAAGRCTTGGSCTAT